MVLRYFIASVLFCAVTMAVTLDGDQLEKKVNKTLHALWPDDAIIKSPIISEHLLAGESAYQLSKGEELVGYYIVDKARSKFDDFDFMVVFDPEGNIMLPAVLIYREDYGGEICSKRWLKQFIGLDSDSDMRLGQEVQNISGATISCESASRGFKNASERIKAIIDE